MAPLITATELAARRNEPFLAVVDGSWHMPGTRDARAEYKEAHIAGASFLDLEECSDHRSALPHMLPTPEVFAEYASARGIGNAHEVVVYDRVGCFSAARWWWMFRAFGHEKVRVLDGGLPAWLRADFEVTDKLPHPRPEHFDAALQPGLLATRAQVEDQLAAKGAVLDARPNTRFSGREKEPRPGLRSGHMQGAANLPYKDVLNADGTFRTADEIRALVPGFAEDSLVMTTCGSGVTACILALALEIAGYRNVAVYDGSWAEWGASDLPIATSSG